jgi:hypothetical protein
MSWHALLQNTTGKNQSGAKVSLVGDSRREIFGSID